MRSLSLPIISSALLLAGPALAQNSTGSSATNGQMATKHSPAQMEQQLKQSLEKSGFQDIKIRPEAFLVHAKAPDGSRMVMMISPDEVQEVIQSGSSTAPSATPSGGAGTNGSATGGMTTKP